MQGLFYNNNFLNWNDVLNNFDIRISPDGSKLISVPNNLKGELFLPPTITRIGSACFLNSNITKIEFSDTLEAIFENAFVGCNSLSEVALPNSLLYIEDGAFNDCKKLSLVSFRASANVSDDNYKRIFRNCPNVSVADCSRKVFLGTNIFDFDASEDDYVEPVPLVYEKKEPIKPTVEKPTETDTKPLQEEVFFDETKKVENIAKDEKVSLEREKLLRSLDDINSAFNEAMENLK